MPSMSTFPSYMEKHTEQLLKKSEAAFKLAAQTGAGFMRDRIENDPLPLTAWHRGKNETNGFALGARIGSKVQYGGYPADKNSGLMLASVERGSVERSESGIEISFGWTNVQKDYFIKQDTGSYRNGGIGMGLLNPTSHSKGLSAYIRSREVVIAEMKKAGFSVTGGGTL